jgi:DNA-binding transcriptional regulator YhcF (GntR family)
VRAPAFAIAVDDRLDRSPYQQIFEQIRALIERGDLAPGASIPTVRQLASDLGTAPNTVARAYADLAAEGWLVSDGRRGTRVADRTPNTDTRARASALRASLRDFVAELRHRGFTLEEIHQEIERVLERA